MGGVDFSLQFLETLEEGIAVRISNLVIFYFGITGKLRKLC